MELLRKRRTREITGPTPSAVGILAKATLKKPMEYLILERRKQEQLRNEANALVQSTKQFDLKTTWEMETDKKVQRNTIKRQVENILQKEQHSLEERRDKLKYLLLSEEEEYLKEMTTKQETTLERQAKMRERAKTLRDKREAERLELVERQLEKHWRNQCEELRAIQSKKDQDLVIRERNEQLKIKDELIQCQEQEEKMYAELWKQDMLAKSKREEMEAVLQLDRNQEMLRELNLQTSALEKQKEEMQKLKEQEGELLREQAMLREVEKKRMQETKLKNQGDTRSMLDYSLKLKMKRKAKEVQEELALDMKILEQLLKQSDNEAMERAQRKRELHQEVFVYREHLAQQKKEEEEKDKELDGLIQTEVEKQWTRRLEQWRKEKATRKKLMQDVLEKRRQQVEEKLLWISEQRKEAEHERDKIQANIAEHKKLEAQQQAKIKGTNIQHHDDLLQQLRHQKKLKEYEKQREVEDFEQAKDAEKQYQQKLCETLSNLPLDAVHPTRLLYSK